MYFSKPILILRVTYAQFYWLLPSTDLIQKTFLFLFATYYRADPVGHAV
jgi:hypothetical protein